MRSLSITVRSLALLALVGSADVGAQAPQGIGSPFSAYGFGDLFHATQVSQALMGVSGIGLADPFSLSSSNPATYPFLGRPVFEAGGVGRFMGYSQGEQARSGQRTELLGLSIGVPFARNKWGIGLGLAPMSTVGYLINDTRALPAGDGNVTFQYSGDGGLNRAFFGVGRVLWATNDTLDRGRVLSFGANFNYLFGSIEEARKAYYPVGAGYYSTSVTSRLNLRSPVIGLGLQWAGDLKGREQVAAAMEARRKARLEQDRRDEEDWINAGKDPKERKGLKLHNRPPEPVRYRVGLSAELPANVHARHSGLSNTFLAGNSGVEYALDTAWWQEGVIGTVALPMALGAGFTVSDPRWTITAEYRLRDWSSLSVDVEGFQPHAVTSTQSIYGLGGTFRPAGNSNGNNFWQRNTYRAGLRYTDDYLVVGGQQLREMAASAGLSVPLMALTTRSRFHIGVEVGERSGAADALRERFTNIYVGVAITPESWDQWFRKRRID